MVTHQLQVRCRPLKVRRSETDVLPLSHPTNKHVLRPNFHNDRQNQHQIQRHCLYYASSAAWNTLTAPPNLHLASSGGMLNPTLLLLLYRQLTANSLSLPAFKRWHKTFLLNSGRLQLCSTFMLLFTLICTFNWWLLGRIRSV